MPKRRQKAIRDNLSLRDLIAYADPVSNLFLHEFIVSPFPPSLISPAIFLFPPTPNFSIIFSSPHLLSTFPPNSAPVVFFGEASLLFHFHICFPTFFCFQLFVINSFQQLRLIFPRLFSRKEPLLSIPPTFPSFSSRSIFRTPTPAKNPQFCSF